MSHSKFFESHQLYHVKDMMLKADERQFMNVQTAELKDPTLMLVISLLIGGLGIDRFMLGDTGLGLGKLLTCGGLGIWAIVDWFLIMGRTREVNLQKLHQSLM